MRVVCTISRTRDPSLQHTQAKRLEATYPLADSTVNLTVGKEYIVYAVRGGGSGCTYYVLGDANVGCPSGYPDFMFRISDATLPKAWVVGRASGGIETLRDGEWMAHSPWRERGDLFYEQLMDDSPEELRQFAIMRKELETTEPEAESEPD